MSKETDIATEAFKSSPSIAVGSLSLMGVGLSDWLIIITLIYTILQMYFLLRDKWWKNRKD